MLCGDGITAGDIVKLCLKEDTGVDYAVPQPWLDQVRRLDIKTRFVWSYRKKDGNTTFGHLRSTRRYGAGRYHRRGAG